MEKNPTIEETLQKLNEVQVQLANLSIEKSNLERELREKLQKQKGPPKPVNQGSCKPRRAVHYKRRVGQSLVNITDRYGTAITKDCTVTVLTKGKFHSRSGRVTHVTEHRVHFIDNNKRPQSRAPHNLEVVN